MTKKQLKNHLIFLFARTLIAFVRSVPRPLALWKARCLAFLFWHLLASERKKTLRHLEDALGDTMTEQARIDTGKQVFRNIAMNLVDAVLQQQRLSKDPEKAMRVEGLELARFAFARGKGVVFLTAHTGCFEMLSPRFSELGFPITVMGAKIYDPRLNELIIQNRKSFKVGYLQRGNDLRSLIQLLRRGEGFGVLCDLDTRAESRFVPFFGRPAKTVSGPFKMGLKLGAVLLPIFTVREPDGSQKSIVFPELVPPSEGDEETKLLAVMTEYNKLLEELIRRDPTQWIWMHERWKSKP